jgi:Ca2+-binding RTX toxin-like protein
MFRRKNEMKSVIRKQRRSMFFEKLNDRCYLAADVTFTVSGSNFLTVNGSDFDDIITVYEDAGTTKIYAEYNGNGGVILDTGVAAALLTGVRVNGRLGGDNISIDSTIGTVSTFLNGQEGDDTLTGGLGKDTIRGNGDSDTLVGGDNNDSLQFDELDTVLDGGAGQDSAVAVDATTGLSLVVDDSWGLEKITGSAFDDVIDASAVTTRIDLLGRAGNDTLTGGSGDDNLFGEGDDDTLNGGDGNDSLTGADGTNTLNGDGGSDTIGYASAPGAVDIDLGSGIANDNGYGLTDTIADVENVRGSAFDDLLVGSSANDEQLYGNGGNDTLIGLGGEDRLDGGAGIDTIDYSASPAAVNVNLGNGLAPEVGGDAQNDSVFAVENVIGSAFNDILVGNGNPNTLDGGDGNDALTGGSGDDTLIGGIGTDTLTGGAGTDSIDGGADNDTVFADSLDDQASTFTGGDGLDNLKAASDSVAVDWILSDLSLFEVISGSNMADIINAAAVTNTGLTINGRNGTDTLTGGALDDTINGGNDADTIYGGTGGDILRGDGGADTIYANDLANTEDNVRDRIFGGADLGDTGVGRNTTVVVANRDTMSADTETQTFA